ncbi:2,3-dihydroxybiphenyl 1,2-dioxygenase [Halobacterium sp. DL1]|jgi:catechol 2,3-dioxygenase|nr:2,3-dihydroxybiphenyl 1,2-dioxygenase [Halobacterium sp. DL1]
MAVCTLGHVELLVPDLAETYDYYHDVLGLEEECREGDSVYLRGWGDFNKFSLTLTEAEESGVGHIAFRVEEPADLERYAERVEDSGYDVEWREAGAEPGHGESIRFTGPAEQPFELFYDIETPDVPKEQRSRLKNQPQKYVDRGVGARRIDHVNCYVPDVTACSEWFQDVLDFDLREELVIEGEDVGKWLSVSPLVHEIAFVEEPEASLNHVAYYLKSRGDLFRAADVLKEHGIEIKGGPGHHGISQANYIYQDDPAGHEVEIFAGGYLIFEPDWETVTWTEEDMPEALYWWGKGRKFSGSREHSDEFED